MSEVKRVIAMILTGGLLLAGTVTAYASEQYSLNSTQHIHLFQAANFHYYRSEYKGYHPYVKYWIVDGSTGEESPVYGTCGVSVNYYKGEWICSCGAGNGAAYTSKEMHSECGK